jgi:cytochrome c2
MKQIRLIVIFFILAIPLILLAKDELALRGKQIFEKDCLKCHPYEGGGSGSSVDLTTYNFDKLKKSKCGLVTKKTDKEIEALAAYLSTLPKN